MSTIILYTGNNCKFCEQMKSILTKRKIEFEERNVDQNDTFFAELKVFFEGQKTYVPTFVVDGKIMTDRDFYRKFIGAKSQ